MRHAQPFLEPWKCCNAKACCLVWIHLVAMVSLEDTLLLECFRQLVAACTFLECVTWLARSHLFHRVHLLRWRENAAFPEV